MKEDVTSLGELLRSTREERKISLEEANRVTKISIKVLSALEQDDFDSFESDIYLKGFVRNYVGFLNLDEDDALRLLERQRGGVARAGEATWEYEESVTEEKLTSPRIFKRFVLPLLFVLILLFAILYVRERQRNVSSDKSGSYIETEAVDVRRA